MIRHAAAQAAIQLDADLRETLDLVVDLVLGFEGLGRAPSQGTAQRVHRSIPAGHRSRHGEGCGGHGVLPLDPARLAHRGGRLPRDLRHHSGRRPHLVLGDGRELPGTMTLLSTHDTKRSEDVRARINAISEYPAEWEDLARALEPRAAQIEGHTRTLWQILWGTWNGALIEPVRLSRYMLKAAKEQKIWTTWTAPDAEGEDALVALARNW